MTLPTIQDVHIDQGTTAFSIALLQNPQNFVAGRVFQNVSVPHASDKYYTFSREWFNRDEMRERAPGADFAEIEFEVSNTSYTTIQRAIQVRIPDEIRANADEGVAYDRAVAQLLTHQALIERERSWTNAYFKTGVWDTDITGVAATPATGQALQWNDASSTPIEDVHAGIDTIEEDVGVTPNVMVVGKQVYRSLINHPDIQDRIKGGTTPQNPSIASLNVLAEIFEVEEVMVGRGTRNTANEGATAAHSYILGKNALLTYRPPSPALFQPAAGYTLNWNFDGSPNEFGFIAEMVRDDKRKSDLRRAYNQYTHQLTSSALGYFWSGIVA